jgi:hypothetical protein
MKKLFLASSMLFSMVAFAQHGPGHQNTHIRNHPAVNKVNNRIDNQEKRIAQERKEGDLSKKQAAADRNNLKRVNNEKRDMREDDHGHLTKAEYRKLNRQLNGNSKRIGK